MKKKDEILKKYNQKLSNLKKHNKFYFTDDSPKISDAEYDKLKNILKANGDVEKSDEILLRIANSAFSDWTIAITKNLAKAQLQTNI